MICFSKKVIFHHGHGPFCQICIVKPAVMRCTFVLTVIQMAVILVYTTTCMAGEKLDS